MLRRGVGYAAPRLGAEGVEEEEEEEEEWW